MDVEYRFVGQLTYDEHLECHKALAAKRRMWQRAALLSAAVFAVVYGPFFSGTGGKP